MSAVESDEIVAIVEDDLRSMIHHGTLAHGDQEHWGWAEHATYLLTFASLAALRTNRLVGTGHDGWLQVEAEAPSDEFSPAFCALQIISAMSRDDQPAALALVGALDFEQFTDVTISVIRLAVAVTERLAA